MIFFNCCSIVSVLHIMYLSQMYCMCFSKPYFMFTLILLFHVYVFSILCNCYVLFNKAYITHIASLLLSTRLLILLLNQVRRFSFNKFVLDKSQNIIIEYLKNYRFIGSQIIGAGEGILFLTETCDGNCNIKYK